MKQFFITKRMELESNTQREDLLEKRGTST